MKNIKIILELGRTNLLQSVLHILKKSEINNITSNNKKMPSKNELQEFDSKTPHASRIQPLLLQALLAVQISLQIPQFLLAPRIAFPL